VPRDPKKQGKYVLDWYDLKTQLLSKDKQQVNINGLVYQKKHTHVQRNARVGQPNKTLIDQSARKYMDQTGRE
jgi:hypothetical protein